MDSLTTTGDGEAKTMTSDSGEQQRQVPFTRLCYQWWLWKLRLSTVPVDASPAGPKPADLALQDARGWRTPLVLCHLWK